MIDAVQASKFITTRKSTELIKKLEGMASKFEAQQLQRDVFIYNRPKTDNETIYYNVDQIHNALPEPLIQELEEKQPEKYKKKIKKQLLKNAMRDNTFGLIDDKRKAADLNGAPSWNKIRGPSINVLKSIVVAYLINISTNRTLERAQWYFVTSTGDALKNILIVSI